MTSAALDALLAVQDHDLAADRLRHRRESLPDRSVVVEHEAAITRVDGELSGVRARAQELGRTQRRLEDEVASLEGKAGEADRRLYSGAVTAPRELQSLQDEVGSLRRRAGTLEDELLEVMEAAEPVDQELGRLEALRAGHGADADRARQAVAEAEAVIDAELAQLQADRDAAATRVPPELLATYEGLRRRLGGIGVARLEAGRCGGCHLALPAAELDAIRHLPEDAVARHEECGRILVR